MPHFYDEKTNKLFDCDIKTARENGLYKSISALTHMVDNFSLIKYRENQLLLSALTGARGKLSEDEYIDKIKNDADEERDKAAMFGQDVHSEIFNLLNGNSYPLMSINVGNCAKSAVNFLCENDPKLKILYCEENFVSKKYKYGCKIDLLIEHNGKNILIDWKTNKFKGGKYQAYKTNAWQLAGQAMAIEECTDIKIDEYINIGINTDPDNIGEIQVKNWKDKNGKMLIDLKRGFEIIPLLSQVYDILNNL